MRIDEEYSDVLQNIASAIVIVFDSEPKLVVRDVLAALDSMLRNYERETPDGFFQSLDEAPRRIQCILVEVVLWPQQHLLALVHAEGQACPLSRLAMN